MKNPNAPPERGLIIAVLLALFLAAIDSTVVGTLIPTIVSDVQGFELYPWLISGFLLASTVVTPIYGKLADVIGYRTSYLAAIGTFLVGSVLVAMAHSMPMLVLARVIQGLGAGGIPVLSYVIFAAIFPLEKRGKAQGFLSSVWGIAAIVGPAGGSALSKVAGWRAVFLINIPLGLIAMGIVFKMLASRIEGARNPFDGKGLVLFSLALSSFLVVAMGPSTGLGLGPIVGLLGLFVVSLTLLIRHSLRAGENAFLPLNFFRRKPLLACSMLNVLASIILYATVTFTPQFIQGVRGYTVVTAGLTVMCAALGWVAGAAVGGALLQRLGYRGTVVLGSGFLLAGAVLLALLGPGSSLPMAFAGEACTGIGIGFVATATLVAAQSFVSKQQLGSVTANVQLFRNLGATLGVNCLGALQVALVVRAGGSAGMAGQLGERAHAMVASASVLYDSLHVGFLVLVAVALAPLALLWLIPRSARRAPGVASAEPTPEPGVPGPRPVEA